MDIYFENNGYERVSLDRVTDLNTPTHKGIDGVYYNPDGHPPYIVAEAKYGSSRLGKTVDGPQMSNDWLLGTKTGNNRILDAVGDKRIAEELMEALDNNEIGRILTKIDKDGNIVEYLLDAEGKVIVL